MIHILSFTIALLITSPLQAAEALLEVKTIGNRVERIYDINKDKKPDFIEVFKNKILAERKVDLDFDGTFDRESIFFADPDAEFSEIMSERKHGKFPRKQVNYWSDLKNKKLMSLTRIDKNNDGKWDHEYKTSAELDQKSEDCRQQPAGFQEAISLSQTGLAAATMTDEYLLTSWGHKIHRSCLDNGKKDWFLSNTEKAIKEGMSCLDRLGREGGVGAARNNASLESLLSNNNVQMICNETGYNWGGGTIAHATTGADRNNAQLTHPAISVNPASITEYRSQGVDGALEFTRTIFHEQLHNLGHKHNHDIEYAYTCEKCCFPAGDDKQELTDMACKVCSGNYNSGTDLEYVKDITRYGEITYEKSHGLSSSLNFLKENPGDVDGLNYLALNLSGVFNPIGEHLAEKVKTSNTLTAEQLAIVSEAQKYKGMPLQATYAPSAKIIADAYYESYKSGNPKAALDLIQRELTTIKQQLNLQDPEADGKYVRDNLKSGLKKMVFDIWLYDFAGNLEDETKKKALKDQAYEITRELNL